MSTEQKENLDAILRQSAFPFDSDVSEQRRLLAEFGPGPSRWRAASPGTPKPDRRAGPGRPR